jgi:hypothetical protein
MKTLTLILLTCASFFQAQISPNDFRPIFGQWKGELTYSDYKTGRPIKIPVEMKVAEARSANSIILSYSYPKEPQANSNDTMRIATDGKMLNDKNIVSVKKENNLVVITAERSGDDNNKPATLRYNYSIGKNQFVIRKEVKYNDTDNFIFRNEYIFRR